MRHYVGIGENSFCRVITGVGQLYIAGKLLVLVAELEAAGREQHAVPRFISDLDPGDVHAGVFERSQDICGVVGDVFAHFLQVVFVGRPVGGDDLPARVGKEVAVVEVDHQFHASSFDFFGQVHDVVFPAPATVGLYPDAKADGIDAAVLQHIQQGGRCAVLFLERPAVVLHFGGPADVRPLGETDR